MDMCCEHASRQHTSLGQTSKANHSAKIKQWYMYVMSPHPLHTHTHVASLQQLIQSAFVARHI